MVSPRSMVRHLVLLSLVFGVLPARAEEAFRYPEGKYEKGWLRYVNGLPVLSVRGSPQDIGRQEANLISRSARQLISYPKNLLELLGKRDQWPKLLEKSRALASQFPPDHLKELEAFAATTGVDRDLLLVANTMTDVYRGGFGCSSLIVEPGRSATGGPLFGRNLDFFTLGVIHKYTLVVACRPQGKHAFVSIGFPGLFGCLSGMNDAGLALAVHEVFFSRDGAAMFNPKGTPYTLCFRRILEECTTVEEAEKLLRSMERTTLLNLAVCDRRRGGVLEMTPKTVVFRPAEDGICVCTNHFCSEALATLAFSVRYARLMKSKAIEKLDVADVAKKLHEVNQGRMTMHTMVFQPAPLVLHLAFGSCPSSALPLKRLELAPVFEAKTLKTTNSSSNE